MIIMMKKIMKNELPKHLGGHMNVNHVDEGALKTIHEKFSISSLLDVGCGLGEMKFPHSPSVPRGAYYVE